MAKKSFGEFQFQAIGVVRTPFRTKFGIPRQPGLAESAKGVIQLKNDPDIKTALRSLEEFSHLWIIFVFHEHGGKKWKPSIRPPRLGGARKVGVLSSRSPHRPNPIGMSVVAIEKIDLDAHDGPEIHVSGVDLLDGTPVLDIKPYIPYVDAVPKANSGWAEAPIERYDVVFSEEAENDLKAHETTSINLRRMMIEILELDPRPAFQKRQIPVADSKSLGTKFGIEIQGFEVKYEITANGFLITSVSR